jgi:hypothetical protein
VYPLEKGIKDSVNISGKYDIVFLNVENIQMITAIKDKSDGKE